MVPLSVLRFSREQYSPAWPGLRLHRSEDDSGLLGALSVPIGQLASVATYHDFPSEGTCILLMDTVFGAGVRVA